ncbi:MAG TPA: hypothetical protein VKI44_28030 [Acetobacteraceae bacterium]|nr:hypothetical protein [Acetobacteraceae bacterium]
MPHTAVVTFTARPIEWILQDGGSRDWRLNAERARQCEYLVCTQNRHNADFGAPTAPHGAAFLIGRISDVVVSPDRHDRWLIKISEYVECNLPNIWGKYGPLRYPVFYTTLEQLGIDLDKLPPFAPLPSPSPPGAAGGGGISEMVARPVVPSTGRTPPFANHAARPSVMADEPDAWRRLDAILAQLDRVPDLPAPVDPLEWDEHGLPR